jgi:hypothetical protein
MLSKDKDLGAESSDSLEDLLDIDDRQSSLEEALREGLIVGNGLEADFGDGLLAHLVAGVIINRGPDIRRSLQESPDERQAVMRPLIALIDRFSDPQSKI